MPSQHKDKPNLLDKDSKFSKTMAVVLTVAMTTAGTPITASATEEATPTTTSLKDDESSAGTGTSTATESSSSSAADASTAAGSSSESKTQETKTEQSTTTASPTATTSTNKAASSSQGTQSSSDSSTTAATQEQAYPAVELDGSAANGVSVHVSAPEGALPKGATLVVSTADSEAITSAFTKLADGAGNDLAGIAAVRVSFQVNGTEVTPRKSVSITVKDTAISGDTVSLYQLTSATAQPGSPLATVTGGSATAAVKDFPSYYVIAAQKAKPADTTSDTPATADSDQDSQQAAQDDSSDQTANSSSNEATDDSSTTDASDSDAQATDSASDDSGSDSSDTQGESSEQANQKSNDSASTLATDAQLQTYAVDSESLSAQLNSLLATPTVAVENPTVTFVNDSTGESTTGTLAPGVIATNAAASGNIPDGYAFDYASLYNTNVVSFTVDSKGAIHAVTADGKYASIVANTATDLQIHYKGSVAVTYQYTVDGKSVSAADAGTLVGPSGVTPNGTLSFSFTPAAGLSVESVTANGSTVSGSGNSYSVANVTDATTVTINLVSEHTFTFSESSNTLLTYNGRSYNSKSGGTFQYTTGNSVTFQLDRYDQWSTNAKVLNKLTITLADGEHAITIPSAMGSSATTTLSSGTTVTVTKGGSSESPSYTVTITAPSGQNVYGNIKVSTNYKDQQTSEVWATKLVGVDYLEDSSGQQLKPGVFVFYSRNTSYSSTYTFSVNSGYTLDATNPANNVTITATDQNGNALDTSGHWSIKKNYDGSYTITIGSDSGNWQPKDIRISVVATPDATTTYTASYDDGTASGSYTYGGSFVLPENTQAKQGQHFVGWRLEGDTSGTIYKPNDTFNLTDETIPYATNNNFHFVGVWTDNGEAKITVKVVVKKADGTSETAFTSEETVAGGANASIDQDAIEKALVAEYGSDFLSTYEPLNDDQFSVSDVATDGSAEVTIVYCAKMNLSATGFSGMYDGNAHAVSATASVADATIEYSTDGGNTWSTTAPSATNVSESKTGILVRASKDGYKTTQLNGSVSLTVTPRDVTLASASDSKTYDGTALTNGTVTVSGSGFVSGQGATYSVTGSQTEVGSSENSFTYALNEGTNAENYNISQTYGTLKVNAGDISDKDSFVVSQPTDVTYNGKEHKQPVTVSFKGGGQVDASDYDVAYSDDVTDAGTVTVTVTGKGNLTGTVTRTYRIIPAPLTVTTPDATKPYDGTALTAAGTLTGLVNGETATLNTTGSQTEVGTSTNTYDISWGTTKSANYTISEQLGTLTVTPNESTVTVTANSDYKMYDGTPLTNGNVTVTGLPEGLTYEATTTGSITDAGSTTNAVSSFKVLDKNGNDVTSAFTNVKKSDGTLTVTPRDVTLASASDSKTYDGTALTNGTVTVSGSGFVSGQGATYSVTGSQTNAGSSTNSFTYALNDGTNAENYNITKTEGTLTVNQADEATVNVKGNSAELTYTGEEQSVEGYTDDAATVDPTITLKLKDGSQAKATGTNVGTYAMGLTSNDFEATSPNFKTVKVNVTDGALTIKKASFSLVATGESGTVTYDGKAHTLTGITSTGLLDGHALSGLTYEATGTNAGTYNGTFTGSAVVTDAGGTDVTQNYAVTTVPGTLTINAASITDGTRFQLQKPADVTYNGKSQQQDVTVTDATTGQRLQQGRDYTLSYSADTTDAGTVQVKVTGIGNYAGELDTSYDILQKDVTVTADAKSKTYGEADPQLTAQVSGVVEGEDASQLIKYELTRESGEDAGSYAITASGERSQGNYSVSFAGSTLTINAASIQDDSRFQVSQPSDVTYDGQPQKQPVTVTDSATGNALGEGDYTLSYSGDTTNVTDVGVTVTVTGKGNYTGTVTRTYKVNPAQVSVTTGSAQRAYNGQPLTSSDITVEGIVDADKAAVTYATTGSQTEVGSSTNTYTLNWGTAKPTNYSVSEQLGTLTVTAGDISDEDSFVVSQPEDVTYDGKEHKQPVTVSFKGGGQVDASDYDVAYSDDVTDAGTVTVTVTGKGNLTGTVTRTYKITPREITVTTDSAQKVYDGSPLTASGYQVENLADGETVKVTTTGSQTEVGSTSNGFDIEFAVQKNADGSTTNPIVSFFANLFAPKAASDEPTAKQSNYTVKSSLGNLTVTAAEINPDTPLDPNNPGGEKRFTISKPADVTYNGKSQEQHDDVKVHDAATGKDLVEGKDYELSYSADTTNVGEVTVTVKGIGNYTGTPTTSYRINKAKVVLAGTKTVTYDGTEKTYDLNDDAANATGVVDGETLSLQNATITGTEVGEYALADGWTAKVTKADGSDSTGNYDFVVTGTLKIEAAAAKPQQKPTTPAATKTETKTEVKKVEAKQASLPKTGDTTNTAAPAALGVLGAIAAALGIHRRRREDEE